MNWEEVKIVLYLLAATYLVREFLVWFLGTSKLDKIVKELQEIKEYLSKEKQ